MTVVRPQLQIAQLQWDVYEQRGREVRGMEGQFELITKLLTRTNRN